MKMDSAARRRTRRLGAPVLITLSVGAAALMSPSAGATTSAVAVDIEPGETAVVSLTRNGNPANRSSDAPSISDDGSLVVFRVQDKLMLDGEQSKGAHIYLRAQTTPPNLLVDRLPDGSVPEEDRGGRDQVVSGNGRYVAFTSQNKAFTSAADRNREPDVYLRDTVLGTTMLVSRTREGAAGNAESGMDGLGISADGRYVTFTSRASDLVRKDGAGPDVFVFDADKQSVTAVSWLGGGRTVGGNTPVISGDGRFIAFTSYSSELVEGDTNGEFDIFRRDLRSGAIELVSRAAGGGPANGSSFASAISADGQVVVLNSDATNLVSADDTPDTRDLFAYDAETGTNTLVSRNTVGAATGDIEIGEADVSGDGSLVVYASAADDVLPGDRNGARDVFVFDVATEVTNLVSRDPQGGFGEYESYDPGISGDGRYVIFESSAGDLVGGVPISEDVLLHRLR